MKFYYADTGLTSNLGHHANIARAIVGEAYKRQINTTVLAFETVEKCLQDELQAIPLFNSHTYTTTNGNPISGWLTAFIGWSAQLVMKLDEYERSLEQGFSRDDLFYFNSVQPIQLWGIVQWMQRFLPDQLPTVIVEFGVDPGLEIIESGNGYIKSRMRNPIDDARPMLYNFLGENMEDHVLNKLYMTTFEQGCSDGYQAVLGRPVQTMPFPRVADRIINRKENRPITISVLGHQRTDKGYQHVPMIIRKWLETHDASNINFYVHHSGDLVEETRNQIAELEHDFVGFVELDTTTAGDKYWQHLLDKSDLILLPYDEKRFAMSYSAVCCEAIMHGIPVIVPDGTAMARQCKDYECGYTLLKEKDSNYLPQHVVEQIDKMIGDWDNVCQKSVDAAQKWHDNNGADKWLDKALGMKL